MRKIKTIMICTAIVGVVLIALLIFEITLLKLVGLKYASLFALIYFFAIYIFLEMPLSMISNAIPKALKAIGIIESSRSWFSFILNVCTSFTLIYAIDLFVETVSISWQGIMLFAFITSFIDWKVRAKDSEVPAMGSEEMKEIEKKINN